MKQVTLVGPLTIGDKNYVKGDVVSMDEKDADWYTKSIMEDRHAALTNPMVGAVLQSAAPADITARPDVETKVPSNERDYSSGNQQLAVGATVIDQSAKPGETVTNSAVRASETSHQQKVGQDRNSERP